MNTKNDYDKSHYGWLDKNFNAFLIELGYSEQQAAEYQGLIVADGDKAYQYQDRWEDAGIPFNHGVAIYLLSKTHHFSNQVRQTATGWVAPVEWVQDNYMRFKDVLLKAEAKTSSSPHRLDA